MKLAIAKILEREGYIQGFKVAERDGLGSIQIFLKYMGQQQERVIIGLRRISRPGLRHYVGKDQIPWVRRGLGIAILSTSKGLLTDKESRKQQVGGEVLCHVW